MKRTLFVIFFALLCTISVSAQNASESIILATTTSAQQTGLLEILLPAFTKATGISIKPIAVGTGKALALAKNGDADVVMVHARKEEDKFISEGYGENAWDLMYNDFIIAGPAGDEAKIKGSSDIAAVMKKLAESPVKFVSRADKSGTHEKELELWEAAKAKKTGVSYIEAGQGMAETIQMASEKQAYLLCDRATWLLLNKKYQLALLYENPVELKNTYGVIAVSKTKVPKAKTGLADKFVEWVVSPKATKIIEDFKIDGETLFHLQVKKR